MSLAAVVVAGAIALSAALLTTSRPAVDDGDVERYRQIEERYASFKKEFPGVRDMIVPKLVELLERESPVIVDVRPAGERDVSIIPGAVSKDWFEQHREQYHGRLVVTYCTIGARSGRYAARLQQEGFKVANLRGSILAWAHARQPLVDEHGPTTRVHVCGPDWDLLPSGYEPVW